MICHLNANSGCEPLTLCCFVCVLSLSRPFSRPHNLTTPSRTYACGHSWLISTIGTPFFLSIVRFFSFVSPLLEAHYSPRRSRVVETRLTSDGGWWLLHRSVYIVCVITPVHHPSSFSKYSSSGAILGFDFQVHALHAALSHRLVEEIPCD